MMPMECALLAYSTVHVFWSIEVAMQIFFLSKKKGLTHYTIIKNYYFLYHFVTIITPNTLLYEYIHTSIVIHL